jgi:arylsulfatase A-like enzyme
MITRGCAKKWVLAGLLIFSVSLLVFKLTNKRHRPRNVILVTLDTTRADQISCKTESQSVAPRICGLASRGTFYTNAYSQSSWTLPSHASMLTGVYPHEHQASRWHTPINQRFPTVSEILKAAGHKTAAFVGVVWLGEKYGFARGIDNFHFLPYQDGSARAKEISDGAIDWLAKTEDPFFLWVHYFDAHNDFVRHPSDSYQYAADTPMKLSYNNWNVIDKRHASLNKKAYMDLYRGEIMHVDTQLGRLFDYVTSSNLKDNTTIIITADHGESFGNHNHAGHDSTVYRDVIQVPLVVYIPGQSPETRSDIVETRQIAATILKEALADKPTWMAPALPFSDGAAFSDVQNRNRYRKMSVVTKDRHLIYTDEKEVFELYAESDKAQTTDLSQQENYKMLRKLLFERMGIVTHDSETLRQLKSLGYAN